MADSWNATDRAIPGQVATRSAVATSDSARLRVLLLEDSPADARLTQEMLRGFPDDILWDVVATLGEVNTRRLKDVSCALIDLGLPDATGLQALRRLRVLAPTVPIVVLTGFDDEVSGLLALEHGAQDYLIKGYADGYGILRAIRFAIARKKLELALAKVDTERVNALVDLQALTDELDERVQLRTAQLEKEQRALIDARTTLQVAIDTKESLMSRMSHELRTPLNEVLGFAQLLEMDVTTVDDRVNVAHVLNGGRNLLALVEEVISINELKAGGMSLASEPLAIRDVLSEAMTAIVPMAAEQGVDLRIGESTGWPDLVLADRDRLVQILTSVLSNAVCYNHIGGSVTLLRRYPSDDRLAIGIQDTGPGISEAGMVGLFAPFERMNAPEQGVKGTGLELTLARQFAEAMGGDLTVESTVGIGSTFWIELPIGSPLSVT